MDGYNHLDIKITPEMICSEIIKSLGIQKNDIVLEVACGAGFLSQYMKDHCIYLGVDYCGPLIETNCKLHNVAAFECEANNLFFPHNSCNFCFCFGLFQYLPSLIYANEVLDQMFQIARNGVFIGDVRTKSSLKQHMTYTPSWFEKNCMQITPCIYNKDDKTRFNAVVKFDGGENDE